MNKTEFLDALRKALSGLPNDEVDQRLEFYSEMIDDRIEDGLSECEAVSDIGSIDEIVDQITADIPLGRLVKERIKTKKKLSGWNLTLIILGFPVWLPILAAAFAVMLSLYVCIWAIDISLWAVFVSLAGTSLGSVLLSVVCFVQGNIPTALAMSGTALVCVGLAVFSFFGCKAATKGVIALTKKMALVIKRLFVRKGDNNG
ncbi:MAG: DUF1700 domain-containing protein [Clostridia bacterium]|nr:DUF1700 domain-containing protein [Clostridia bacterium]